MYQVIDGKKISQVIKDELKEKGCKQASLAVQKTNYALELYKKLGFKVVDENDEEYIMLCYLY